MDKQAKANVEPVRQTTQYNCMAASMSMALRAVGVDPSECTIDLVNKVMGARPMKGAAWEQALATAQHYGCRATLTMPATVEQLKAWTDAGIPIMIAWNPEGRDWSHASVVFDVDDDLNVYVADPNIPNPKETVRVVPEDDFYHKWFEKFPDYLVRRPACAIEREVTVEGKQIAPRTASAKVAVDYYGRWIREVPGAEHSDKLQLAIGFLEQLAEDDLYISPTAKGALDEFFYDLGSSGAPFPESSHWSLLLAKALRLNAKGVYMKAKSAKTAYGVERLTAASVPKPGDTVTFYHLHSGDAKKGTSALVLSVQSGFTLYGPDEYQPALTVQLENGEKLANVPIHFFRPGAFPKQRDLLELAFKQVAKALKTFGLKRTNSRKRNGRRLEGPYPSVIPMREIEHALLSIPGAKKTGAYVIRIAIPSGAKSFHYYDVTLTPSYTDVNLFDSLEIYFGGMSNHAASAVKVAYGDWYVDSKGYAHDDEGNRWYVNKPEGHYRPGTIPSSDVGGARRPPIPPPRPSEDKAKLTVLDALLAKRPDRFVQSIRDQVAKGRALSEPQLKVVRQILYKNRMRSEADIFRQASVCAGIVEPGPYQARREFRLPPSIRVYPQDLLWVSKADALSRYNLYTNAWEPLAKPWTPSPDQAQEFLAYATPISAAAVEKEQIRLQNIRGTAMKLAKAKSMKDKMKIDKTPVKVRNPGAQALAERGGKGQGSHKNKQDYERGQARNPKHKNQERDASIERIAQGFMQVAVKPFWDTMPHGWKHVDEGIFAWLTWEDTYDMIKDRNVPNLHDVTDPEMMADGIPELMESYSNAAREHAQWVQQGWWPRQVKVPNGGLHLVILSRSGRKSFEARFPKKDMRKALTMGEQAADIIRGSKYPRWMTPIRGAAYSGNPDGKPIYDVSIDHGEEHALSGGHDVMKRLQDQYRIEQGGEARENQEKRLAAETSEWTMNRPFSGMVSDAFIARIKAHPELRQVFSTRGKNATLVLADYFDDPKYNGGSEYDVSFLQVPDAGLWRFNVGQTHGTAIIKKLSDLLRIKPNRIARWNANTPEGIDPVDKLTTRFMAAQGGGNR